MEVGNRSRGIGGHHSHLRITDEWLTPEEWIRALGPFDLDPCAPVKRPWPTAAQHFTIEDDGLRQPWPADDIVWCNPPYSAIAPWAKRLAEHGCGFLMVFARTETSWFHEHVWERAGAVFFLRGRVNFCTPDGRRAKANAGGPTCIAAYGSPAVDRLADFARRGTWGGALVRLDRARGEA